MGTPVLLRALGADFITGRHPQPRVLRRLAAGVLATSAAAWCCRLVQPLSLECGSRGGTFWPFTSCPGAEVLSLQQPPPSHPSISSLHAPRGTFLPGGFEFLKSSAMTHKIHPFFISFWSTSSFNISVNFSSLNAQASRVFPSLSVTGERPEIHLGLKPTLPVYRVHHTEGLHPQGLFGGNR